MRRSQFAKKSMPLPNAGEVTKAYYHNHNHNLILSQGLNDGRILAAQRLLEHPSKTSKSSIDACGNVLLAFGTSQQQAFPTSITVTGTWPDIGSQPAAGMYLRTRSLVHSRGQTTSMRS